MEIEREYNKCNQMPGGDNKWRKNKENSTTQKHKKMLLIKRLFKLTNIEDN